MEDIRDIEISKDNLKELEDALKKDANPDVTMDNGKTYLYNAVEKGEKEIVELLLKYNANPRKKSRIGGDTALHAAAKGDNVKIAIILLNADEGAIEKEKAEALEERNEVIDPIALINKKDDNGMTPSMIAAESNSSQEFAEMLMYADADLDTESNNGESALHIAARMNSYNFMYGVSDLVEAERIIDIEDNFGRTPLIVATIYENEDIAEQLIDIGADENKKDKNGYSRKKILELRKDPNKPCTGIDEDCPLHVAVGKGREDIVKMLLDVEGVDVDIRDKSKATPLMPASTLGNIIIMKMLLDKKADINAVDSGGATALHQSVSGLGPIYKEESILPVELLIKRGADVNTQDLPDEDYVGGNTPLHAAAKVGNKYLIQILLEAGANPSTKNKDGKSPIDETDDPLIKQMIKGVKPIEKDWSPLCKFLLKNNTLFNLREIANEQGIDIPGNLSEDEVCERLSKYIVLNIGWYEGKCDEKDKSELTFIANALGIKAKVPRDAKEQSMLCFKIYRVIEDIYDKDIRGKRPDPELKKKCNDENTLISFEAVEDVDDYIILYTLFKTSEGKWKLIGNCYNRRYLIDAIKGKSMGARIGSKRYYNLDAAKSRGNKEDQELLIKSTDREFVIIPTGERVEMVTRVEEVISKVVPLKHLIFYALKEMDLKLLTFLINEVKLNVNVEDSDEITPLESLYVYPGLRGWDNRDKAEKILINAGAEKGEGFEERIKELKKNIPDKITYWDNGNIKKEEWFKDEKLEKEKQYYENGNIEMEIWYKDGKQHRDGDLPAYIEYYENGNIEMEIWYKDGKEHRDGDLPARIGYYEDGNKEKEEWSKDGKRHRDGNLPASIFYYENGNKKKEMWNKDGSYYREGDLPTYIVYYSNGNMKQELWTNVQGQLHRDDGPAMIIYNEDGSIESKVWVGMGEEVTEVRFKHWPNGNMKEELWFKNEKPHRDDGPAGIEYNEDGSIKKEEWWKDGNKIQAIKV